LGQSPEQKRRNKERYLALAREYCRNGFNKTAAVETVMGWKHETAKNNTHKYFNANEIVIAEVRRLMDLDGKDAEQRVKRIMELLELYAEGGMILAKFKKVDPTSGDLYWDFTGATQEELMTINSLETAEFAEGRGPDARHIKKFKIGHSDPLMALDRLARIHGMYQDNLNVQGELSFKDRINAARNRLANAESDALPPPSDDDESSE
jgi:hypothetical protein